MSYAELMREYARQRGLRRFMVPVPVLTPQPEQSLARTGHSALRAHRPQADREHHARDDRPRRSGALASSASAPERRRGDRRALRNEDREFAETRWSDALSSAGAAAASYGGVRFGPPGRFAGPSGLRVAGAGLRADPPDRRRDRLVRYATGCGASAASSTCWSAGSGMRRGRRDPEELSVGDARRLVAGRVRRAGPLLRFVAEMKVPGRAWLEFEVTPDGERIHDPSDGDLRSLRPGGPGLLVRRLSRPRAGLSGHGRGHLGSGRARRPRPLRDARSDRGRRDRSR